MISSAGDATLSVSDPGHLTNGAFTALPLPQPLRVEIVPTDVDLTGVQRHFDRSRSSRPIAADGRPAHRDVQQDADVHAVDHDSVRTNEGTHQVPRRERRDGARGDRCGQLRDRGPAAAQDRCAPSPGPRPAALAPAPAVPTFVNGMSQAVFATGSANWVNHDLWVELDVDTDGDGKKDRVHADVSRPAETDDGRPEGPRDLRGQPVLRGRRRRRQLGRRPRDRAPAGSCARAPRTSTARVHDPTISTIYESTWVPRGFAVVHAESPGSGNSDRLPELRRPDRDARRHRRHRVAQRQARRATRPGRHRRRSRPYWHNGNVGDDGHVLQRHAADRGRVDRRRGPEGDRPDLRDLRLVRLLPRQRRRPRAGRLPGRGPRRPHRVRVLAQRRGRAPHDLLPD